LGGKNELELGNQIQQNSGVALNNFIGKLSLLETAKIIDESDLLICNDTGLMHIAAARKVPIVAIFGSSVKELGFIPYKTAFQIVEKELWCRPCSHVGRSFCPIGTFKCMNKIEVSDILKSIGKLIHL
jgi:heptosyltransferase-2